MVSLDGLQPFFRRRVEEVQRRTGVGIVSAFRTYAQQLYLWLGWLARRKGFNRAARPGTSNHESRPARKADGIAGGVAVDWDEPYPPVHALSDEMQLYWPVDGEDWHCEPIPGSWTVWDDEEDLGWLGAVA